MKATPRMLWRTVLSFVGGKGSIAASIVMGAFISGTGTASLLFGSLGLCLVLASLGLSPLSSKAKLWGTPVDPYLLSRRAVPP